MGTKPFRALLSAFLIIGVILLFSCTDAPGIDGDGDGSGDDSGQQDDGSDEPVLFTPISGSGYISISISGLTGGDENMSGKSIFYGSNGIQFGGVERIGHTRTVATETETMVISDGGTDFLFTGGSTIRSIGCIIDATGDGMINEGDYTAGETDYVISGNATISYVFPDSFRQISANSTMQMNITGLTPVIGKHVMFGTAGLLFGGTERIGDSGLIDGDSYSEALNDGEGAYTFIGGDVIKGVGCIIDMDDDGEAGDGDYLAGAADITIVPGVSVDFVYPDDFSMISGSGYITLNIEGLSPQAGHDIYYGTCKIPFGNNERVGDQETISLNTISATLSVEGSNYSFLGGVVLPFTGCFIDTNDNGTADDGDYYAGISDITISGSAVYEFEYE